MRFVEWGLCLLAASLSNCSKPAKLRHACLTAANNSQHTRARLQSVLVWLQHVSMTLNAANGTAASDFSKGLIAHLSDCIMRHAA